MTGIHIGSGWFASRTREAAGQLQIAAELGFSGVVLLPGNPHLERAGIVAARQATGRDFPAATWDSLWPREDRAEVDPASADTAHQEACRRIPTVLKDLNELGSRMLIVGGGLQSGVGIRERSDRLLGRLRSGEAVSRDDEALEHLTALGTDLETSLARGRQLENLARFVHELLARAPGLVVALAPDPSPAGILNPASLGQLLADTSLRGVGYWHGVGVVEARAGLGLEEPGQWLDLLGARILGVTLEDFAEGRDALPPGAGTADWRLLAEYLPRTALRVLSVAPAYPGGAALEGRNALESLGIR